LLDRKMTTHILSTRGNCSKPLISEYLLAREAIVAKMKRKGWRASMTLTEQREWVDGIKRDKTKIMGVMLVSQLAGLIEKLQTSTEEKNLGNNQVMSMQQRKELKDKDLTAEIAQGMERMDPLPSYESVQGGATAPVGDGGVQNYNLAPVTRGGTVALPKATYKPFTPGERQQIIASLGKLKPRSANLEFWGELDTLWVGHQLHLRDIHQLIRAACPTDRWRLVAGGPAAHPDQDYNGGRWAYAVPVLAEIDVQQPPFALFKTEIQRVLGNTPTNWNRITSTKQKKEEGASEFGERLFQVYSECSGQDRAERNDRAFIQAFKDGLSDTHQDILSMGVIASHNYDELVEWASGIKEAKATQAKPRAERARNPRDEGERGTGYACHRCGQKGHIARHCKEPPRRDRYEDGGPRCDYCHRIGHTRQSCWEIHGRPQEYTRPPMGAPHPRDHRG